MSTTATLLYSVTLASPNIMASPIALSSQILNAYQYYHIIILGNTYADDLIN